MITYYAFTNREDAQAYADAAQLKLKKKPGYIASAWSAVIEGTDGRFYVEALPALASVVSTADSIPLPDAQIE